MTARPLTCVSCGKPFPLNGELASIPDGNRVAFDPAHRRVWRICASCNEWNLLGAGASAAALPELVARFSAAAPSGAPELRCALARVSDRLELLRLGPADLSEPDASAALRLRNNVERIARIQNRAKLVLAFLFVAWIAIVLWFAHGDPVVPVLMLLVSSAGDLVSRLTDKVRGKQVSTTALVVNVALTVLGAVAIVLLGQAVDLLYLAGGLVLTAPFTIFVRPRLPGGVKSVRVRLPDGSRLLVKQPALEAISLSWTTGETDFVVHDVRGHSPVGGADAIAFTRSAAQMLASRASEGVPEIMVKANAMIRDAHALITAVGGLTGLLNALEGYRRDNDGRLPLAQLPPVYLTALDLALASQRDPGGAAADLVDRMHAAATLAEHADWLEREALHPRTDTAPQP